MAYCIGDDDVASNLVKVISTTKVNDDAVTPLHRLMFLAYVRAWQPIPGGP